MIKPLVSIVIPFYSKVDWLIQALDSVENQVFKDFEVIIVNDGGKENIDFLKKKYTCKINVLYKKNGGPASARNLGIKNAKGKYIAFLDADDLWLKDKLQKQINEMEKKNSIWSQHSYEMFWDNSNKKKIIDTSIYKGEVFLDCFISLKIQTSCVVVRRDFILKNKIYFPINKRFGQDCSFYKEISDKVPLDYVEGVLSKFRIRKGNAGFRAKVQLNDKGEVYQEIKNDKKLSSKINLFLKHGYFLCSKGSKIIRYFERTKKIDEGIIEIISKVLYFYPYFVFKVSSKMKGK